MYEMTGLDETHPIDDVVQRVQGVLIMQIDVRQGILGIRLKLISGRCDKWFRRIRSPRAIILVLLLRLALVWRLIDIARR